MEAPAPGIYEDVPFCEYVEWPCISNSSLGAAERSMLHYKSRKRVEETPQMRFGSFCHLGRLEPSALYRRYIVMPDLTVGLLNDEGQPYYNPRATKAYKKRVTEFKASHTDKQIVEQADFDRMVGVVSALDRDPLAREWFSSDGPTEVSIVWIDPDTGLLCKARIDKWAQSLRLVADMKTCADGLRFANDIATRNYHRQGAMYIDGLMVLCGGELCDFGLAAVESEEPHGTMTAPVSEDAIEVGRDQYKRCLSAIKQARDSGIWRGYESPAQWNLPAWKSAASEPFTLTIRGELVAL